MVRLTHNAIQLSLTHTHTHTPLFPITHVPFHIIHNPRYTYNLRYTIHDTRIIHDRHDPYAGDNEPVPETAEEQERREEKRQQVLQMARKQNLTDGASRDDFALKLYKGLKPGKRRRNQDEPDAYELQRLAQQQELMQEGFSSSEDEFIHVDKITDDKHNKKNRPKKHKKSKRKKKRRHHRSNSDTDSDNDSDDSSNSETLSHESR